MLESIATILHDHYKDTFELIREREKQRDRLFLVVIAILGALVLQLSYTAAAARLISEVEFFGVKVQIDQVPMPALLSATWTFLAALLLRYYQVTVHVEKQYGYLHALEVQLSGAIGIESVISRENTGYLTQKYQRFRTIVWLFYVAVFPAIVIVTAVSLISLEWMGTGIPVVHKCYDTFLAVGVVALVGLYIGGVMTSGSDDS